MEGKPLLAQIDKEKRKIVRACRFHVSSTYGSISFHQFAAEVHLFSLDIGIFCFVNSYC